MRGLVRAFIAAACVAVALLVAPTAALAEEAGPVDPGALVDTFVASAAPVRGLAVLASNGGVVDVERYYGVAGDGAEAGEGSVFEWGRCSDLIVWASVMLLVERGELFLDDEVGQYLPEGVVLPDGYASLAVGDLMDHTSGLDVAMIGSRSSIPAGTLSVSPAFALFDVKADRAPGDEVAYTPFDVLLASAVVEAVSGEEFCAFARSNVLEPLGIGGVDIAVGGPSLQGGVPAPGMRLVPDVSQGILGVGVQTASSIQTTSSGTVFTCTGTARDLLRLAEGLMASRSSGGLFEADQTPATLFTVTRTYPGLGIARVAHGMFAFPLSPGVFGISASTSSGYSAAAFMDAGSKTAIVVLADEAGRFDLVQGIPRVLVGRSDALSAQPPGPADATWSGTYQDASKPDHGPAKLITALTRTRVGTSENGAITFDGLTATSLGAGVYSIDTAQDQDVYRFHVSLDRGEEFSRATSDSYIVPASVLAVEKYLLLGLFLGLVVSLAWTAWQTGSWVRARIRRRRARVQVGILALAALTCLAGGAAVFMVSQLADGVAPSALGVWLVGEGLYVATAVALSLWILFTRLAGSGYSTAQKALACLEVAGSFMVIANLVYWEMLP